MAGKRLHNTGGKKYIAKKKQHQGTRRFSVAELSDEVNDLDSELSLTAVSEHERSIYEGKSPGKLPTKIRGKSRPQKRVGGGKISGKAARKGRKSMAAKKAWRFLELSQSDSEDRSLLDLSLDSEGEDAEVARGALNLDEIFVEKFHTSLDDSLDSGDDEGLASSDDEVDFVALQKERKSKGVKGVRAKAPRAAKKRQGSVSKPRFGRRKSQAALPEDIDFTFDFDQEQAIESDKLLEKEEDIGEEVKVPLPDATNKLNFELQVPKINEEELNSDEDYEIDDNELLATLQADQDVDEFDDATLTLHTRSGLIGLLGDDDEAQFLKEEEKFLVNEFENNGFDDDYSRDILSNVNHLNGESRVVQYASSSSSSDEEDEYVDFMDFSVPFIESQTQKKESDDEDDSYLWNYFFSSDNDSESEHRDVVFEENEDQGYDSGDSTDVDESLPFSKLKVGSKVAKEVLSSKTADYRPPVLGTWIAIDSKPFSIIDGLSTRTLQANIKNDRVRKSIVPDDNAMGLDELLNVSELENDDENDLRIWRDFNNKKQVPLGAFRNKAILQNLHDSVPMNYNYTAKERVGKAYSKVKKERRKKRRQSIAEAKQEGFRPTKLGVFSENTLADVEEVFGDDNDLMALIKGLN